MKIGIIGAGQIGATLAQKLNAIGHSIFLANSRGPDTLQEIAHEAGATAVSVHDAAKNVDVIIVSIPEKSISLLPQDLFTGVPENVVVDTGNYYPARDGRIEDIEGGLTESEWVARVLGRPVVKAFNNIVANSLATRNVSTDTPDRICLSVAGDDTHAKEVVLGLIAEIGFDGLDAGLLRESWRQQPGTPAYCQDLDRAGLKAALERADSGEINSCRAKANEVVRPYFL